MPHCRTCGGRLRRIHRSFTERFLYMGIFECSQCKEMKRVARRYTYYLSKEVRCPLCGTTRLRMLLARDRIDRMHRNPLNLLQRYLGGRLYHCRYCRLQFYDRRPLAPEPAVRRTLAG